MNSTVKELPIEQRVFLHGELLQHGVLPTCATCVHGEAVVDDGSHNVHCHKYNASVPLAVIVQGCVGWEQDIPF